MAGSVKKILKVSAISIGSLFILVVLILGGVSLYLTPARLTRIINQEVSKELKADLRAHNVRYTLWKSFPRLDIETDSVVIYSRTLDNISPDITRQLPDNAEFLGALKSFYGQINVIDFISGRYVIHNAKVDGLSINLVAYNDSINNYDIIPDSVSGFKKVPYFTANSIEINNAGKMTYFSAATNTTADLDLRTVSLRRLDRAPIFGKRVNDYKLTINGRITAATDGLTLLDKFPFDLNGDVRLRFDPFGVMLTDYDINLGNIAGKLNMDLGIGDNPALNKFEYNISTLNLMKLLGYLPQRYMPDLTGIQAELPVALSARLTSPWHLSSQQLPSLQVNLDIPEGDICYTVERQDGNPWSGQRFTLTHSPITGTFNFDGRNTDLSTVVINPFTVSADGISCTTQAQVTQLTSRPLVDIALECEADVARAMRWLKSLDKFVSSGNLGINADLSFRLTDFSDKAIANGLYDMKAKADISLNNAKFNMESQGVRATADKMLLSVSTSAPHITENNYTSLPLKTSLTIAKADADFNGNKVALRQFNAFAGALDPSDLNHLRLSLNADRIDFFTGKDKISASRPQISLNLARRDRAYQFAQSAIPTDSRIEGLEHTPLYLTVKAPEGIRSFLAQFDFTSLISAARIIHSDNSPATPDVVRDFRATVSPDRLDIHQFATDIQSTHARFGADIAGLRDFLLDTVGAQPIYANIRADLDTVNINTLAHSYFSSRGGVPQQKTTVSPLASDSIAYLIPRNITADIAAGAKETVYTNLHLYDLNTAITIRDGKAAVRDLNISSDFGHAALNLIYDTADVDSIGFKADLAVTDVNIVNFFKNFHALLMMMPQMKNLDGNLSVYAALGGQIFPDMVINMPSLHANLNLQGRGLVVHQSDFIRRVTRMMLITNDDDLHIKDMDVFAHIHGNLLQLDPFLFEFDNYKLRMQGINNFNGDLYYQVSLIENPFHIPFGIRIEGLFHHPKLRFSDTDYNTEKALRVSQSIMEQNNTNIVGMMKGFLNEFLRKAAQAATDPNLSL